MWCLLVSDGILFIHSSYWLKDLYLITSLFVFVVEEVSKPAEGISEKPDEHVEKSEVAPSI